MKIVCCLEFGAVYSWGAACEMHLIHTHRQSIVIIQISGAACVCSLVSAASTSRYQTISIQFQLVLCIDVFLYKFWCAFPEDDPQRVETCCSSGLICKIALYCNIVHLLVFSWITCRISYFSHFLDGASRIYLCNKEPTRCTCWMCVLLVLHCEYRQDVLHYQLMHKRIALKRVLKFTLKQIQHVLV
jgi:hypothetical protein